MTRDGTCETRSSIVYAIDAEKLCARATKSLKCGYENGKRVVRYGLSSVRFRVRLNDDKRLSIRLNRVGHGNTPHNICKWKITRSPIGVVVARALSVSIYRGRTKRNRRTRVSSSTTPLCDNAERNIRQFN